MTPGDEARRIPTIERQEGAPYYVLFAYYSGRHSTVIDLYENIYGGPDLAAAEHHARLAVAAGARRVWITQLVATCT